MKTRLATLTTILATAALALTACAGGSGSSTAQSEATAQEATASSTLVRADAIAMWTTDSMSGRLAKGSPRQPRSSSL